MSSSAKSASSETKKVAAKKAVKPSSRPAERAATLAVSTVREGAEKVKYEVCQAKNGRNYWAKVRTGLPDAEMARKFEEGTRLAPPYRLCDTEVGMRLPGKAPSRCRKDSDKRCTTCRGNTKTCPPEDAVYEVRSVKTASGPSREFVCISHPMPPVGSKVVMGKDKDGRRKCVKFMEANGFKWVIVRGFMSGVYFQTADEPKADTFSKLPKGQQVENMHFYSGSLKELMVVQRVAQTKEKPEGRLQTFRWTKVNREDRSRVRADTHMTIKAKKAELRRLKKLSKQLEFYGLIKGDPSRLIRNASGSIVFKKRSESARKAMKDSTKRMDAFKAQQRKAGGKRKAEAEPEPVKPKAVKKARKASTAGKKKPAAGGKNAAGGKKKAGKKAAAGGKKKAGKKAAAGGKKKAGKKAAAGAKK